jgi:tetratricopeptide (TPR) repeat protein
MLHEVIRPFVFVIALAGPQMGGLDGPVSAALSELQKGRVLESIQQFKDIVRNDPQNDSSYFYLSTLYTRMNEYTPAERYIQRAIEITPKQGAYYHQFGLIRYRQKKWRAALDLFKRALEVGAGNNEAAVWKSIGDVQLELFDRDAALQAYNRALQIQPRDVQTHLALGTFYLDRGEPDQAIERLRAALQADPSNREANSLLGRAYRQSGDMASAVSVLKKALDSNPADQDSRYLLGRTLIAMERVDEGRQELDRYEKIRQQVTTADRDYKDALARLADGKSAEAEKLLRDAVQFAPTYGPALYSLGVLLLDHGSPDKAVPLLTRAAEANPLNAATWYNLASAQFKAGKIPEAAEAVKRAVVLGDDDVEYQHLLAQIQERLKRR